MSKKEQVPMICLGCGWTGDLDEIEFDEDGGDMICPQCKTKAVEFEGTHEDPIVILTKADIDRAFPPEKGWHKSPAPSYGQLILDNKMAGKNITVRCMTSLDENTLVSLEDKASIKIWAFRSIFHEGMRKPAYRGVCGAIDVWRFKEWEEKLAQAKRQIWEVIKKYK